MNVFHRNSLASFCPRATCNGTLDQNFGSSPMTLSTPLKYSLGRSTMFSIAAPISSFCLALWYNSVNCFDVRKKKKKKNQNQFNQSPPHTSHIHSPYHSIIPLTSLSPPLTTSSPLPHHIPSKLSIAPSEIPFPPFVPIWYP